ncbi:hypothetical protein BCR42DRAFT_438120 [Absidia repens]|uniref:START domain-containing protein n=1 Tax=Absidia repens TaxID=90262 RepID=A0A1X2IG23_9FUNG|nr:hypothetical protein BCR42DRAFT_438120 [Absidia repens]
MNYSKKPTADNPRQKYTTIFSDDEEDESLTPSSSPWTVIPLLRPHRTSFPPRFIDPLQTSPSYHVHQAEMALFNLKSAVLYDDQDSDSGWKKVLAHKKSGVIIRMKSPPTSSLSSSVLPSSDNNGNNNQKAPMFKGEVIFEGFTPHSIFYVIGMRKLWDQNYEDGNLVENLNETTSLTYEVCKQTSATNVETPKVPRLQHRVRAQVKLMGWVLEPISSGAVPLTKVTFVIQEPVKGWMSGLTKKSMARRPLIVISSVHNYLKAKSERQAAQQEWCGTIKKRPSLMMMGGSSSYQSSCHKNSSSSLFHSQQTLATQTSIPTTNTTTTTCTNNKHITFATAVTGAPPEDTDSPQPILSNGVHKTGAFDDETHHTQSYSLNAPVLQHMYSPHRHLRTRNESIHLLKQLYLTLNDWHLESATKSSSTYTKEHMGVTYSRLDGHIQGDWIPEQLCSLIHSVHVRKHWDECWQQGRIVERFSQKDYLMHWKLAGSTPQDMAVITHIDSEHGGSRIFMVSKSVLDAQIPKQDGYTRTNMALYGWVFTIKSFSTASDRKKPESAPELQVSFIVDASLPWAQKLTNDDKSGLIEPPPSSPPTPPPFCSSTQLTCLTNVQSYLSTQGCPPYIRRVSGKVIMEHFDNDIYQVSWIAKHYPPPSSYRQAASSGEPTTCSSSWYTDIRLDHLMYHQGYDIDITPTQGTRMDIKPNQKTIKVFTTNASMEGATIHIKITHRRNCSPPLPPPLTTTAVSTAKSLTELRKSQSLQNISHRRNVSSPGSDGMHECLSSSLSPARKIPTASSTSASSSTTTTSSSSSSNNNNNNNNNNNTSTSTSTTITNTHSATNNKRSSVAQRPRCVSSSSTSSNHHHHPAALHIPKGYMLIPQPNQNQHLLNLTDDLTFNGQQLVVMLFGMVMSYYMGKLACSC